MDELQKLARELCIDDGINPDEVNWMGDPDIPNGTCSWKRWQEYIEEAKDKLDDD